MTSAPHDPAAPPAWTFPYCPRPPLWTLEWDSLLADCAWLRELDGCPQDPIYHAEGDVLQHTHMICEALVALAEWRALHAEARSVLFAAALLHDIAKPACTVIEGARIHSRGHAALGARVARLLLWRGQSDARGTARVQALAPPSRRNDIVALVRHHHLPVRLLDQPAPQRAVIAASQTARCDWLALLAEADVRGRLCDDQPALLERVALFRAYCEEQQCLRGPRAFASDHSRFLYFRHDDRDPTYAAYDDTLCEVVLLAGLPGAGKTTWRRTHLPDWPTISLDEVRSTLRIAPDQEQAPVISQAKATARAWLRDCRSLVWDATNTTRALRAQLIDLFAAYGARIRIVYVEAPYEDLVRRNRTRVRPVPEAVIERLAQRLALPDLTEAHAVDLVET